MASRQEWLLQWEEVVEDTELIHLKEIDSQAWELQL